MDASKFAERLAELISENETTAKELGEKIGCGNATISHYLTGRYLPNLDMAVRLADYFNCSVDYLLGIKNDTDKQFKECPPFSDQFRKVCKDSKTSRYKLQKLTGISESVMRYWAQGKTKPSIASIVSIAKEIDCTIDYLLGRES